jgi:uncharacterized protein (TIGR03435 family)
MAMRARRKRLRGLVLLAATAIIVLFAIDGTQANAQAAAQPDVPASPAAPQASSPAPPSPPPTALATDIIGTWQGTLHIPAAENHPRIDLRLVVKISRTDAVALRAVWYSIDQGGQSVPVATVNFQDGVLKFAITVVPRSYEGKISADGKSIAGTWMEGATPIPMLLERANADTAWPIPEPVKPMAADAHPSLEVATIKPSQPGARGKKFGFNGTHFRTFNFDVNDMIAIGFGLHTKQIIGAPDWLATDLYDIDGVPDVPGRPSIKQMGEILQRLLVDRFALQFHIEKRELPVYVIQIASGGPRMKESTAGPSDPEGFGFRGLGDLSVLNMTMKDFAFGMQSAVTDRPVVDQTGLTGRYDFSLKWTPDDSQFAQFRGAVGPQPPAGDNPNAPPSLFTAMQETLGLKFSATKAMDDVIIIDHIEKPSPN